MKTKIKKTIAKEIIYFFSIISLLLIVFIGIEIRNSFLNNEINNFSKAISTLNIKINSIQKRKLEKENTKPKFDEYGILFKNTDYFNVIDNTMQLKKADEEKLDNIMQEMQNNNESDENKKIVANDFLDKYGIKKISNSYLIFEELKKNKKETIEKIKIIENKVLNTKDTIIYLLFLLFGLLYPVRLIYKLLKWAFVIIQTKDKTNE